MDDEDPSEGGTSPQDTTTVLQATPGSPLLALPEELIVTIIDHLSIPEAIALSQINQKFRRVSGLKLLATRTDFVEDLLEWRALLHWRRVNWRRVLNSLDLMSEFERSQLGYAPRTM